VTEGVKVGVWRVAPMTLFPLFFAFLSNTISGRNTAKSILPTILVLDWSMCSLPTNTSAKSGKLHNATGGLSHKSRTLIEAV